MLQVSPASRDDKRGDMTRCPECDPELSPQGPCRGEHHAAVRFGNGYLFEVRKDGEIILDCFEVDVRAGLAWRYHFPLVPCACGGAATAYIDRGRFSFTRSVPAEPVDVP